MKITTRTTKFPYFFWGFNRAYECELDFNKGLYRNLEVKTEYCFKPFNYYTFLLLKYSPILLLFYLTFSIYDFFPNKMTISAYILALFLGLVINFLDNLARKIGVVFLVFLTLFLSFMIENYFLIAYVFKYFIFLSVWIIFYLDLKFVPFSILENNKVICHFLIPKILLSKEKQ